MSPFIVAIGAALLFLLGLRMSFFFSGTETGFYRINSLQLSLKAHQGDRMASQILYFVDRPERFVATVLVGNNIANYIVTLAIGLFTSMVLAESSGAAEIISTIVVTPIVFVFGELIPKSLYYMAPMSLLRSGSAWFMISYIVCLPVSYPLILLSRLIASLGSSDRQPLELVLSRTRLVSVLEAGHREGLLTDLQSQLAENIMQVARQPVSLSMIPAAAAQGTVDTADRAELIRLAQRMRVPRLLLHPPGKPYQWNSYVRIADIIRNDQSPRAAAIRIPEFAANSPRIVVLSELIRSHSEYGAIVDERGVVAVVSRRILLAQLQRVRPRSKTDVSSDR